MKKIVNNTSAMLQKLLSEQPDTEYTKAIKHVFAGNKQLPFLLEHEDMMLVYGFSVCEPYFKCAQCRGQTSNSSCVPSGGTTIYNLPGIIEHLTQEHGIVNAEASSCGHGSDQCT